jgi:hypothetical protein
MLRLRSGRTAALLGLPALLLLASCGGGAGHLTASVESLDFGRVEHGAEPERRFEVKNEGARSVVISAIDPSCKACLRVEPGWRRSLGPGEKTEVVVHLTTALVPAQKLEGKSLHVVSDDEKTPLLQIPVHGEIETRVTLSPQLVRVGPGDGAGRGEPRRVRLRPGQGYVVTVDKVEVLRPDWFEAPLEKVPEGIDVLLTFKPDPARRGPVDTFVRLHTTVTGRGLPPQKYELTILIQGTW